MAQSAAYGRMRQGRPGVRGAFVQVESRMSLTGASADEWVPVKPGTEGVLALGLAHVDPARQAAAGRRGGRAGALIDGWAGGSRRLRAGEGRADHRRHGRARIERLARELAEQQPAVAIVGGAPLAQTNGAVHGARRQRAERAARCASDSRAACLFTPQIPMAGPPRSKPNARHVRRGRRRRPSAVGVLLVDDANPVFAAPKAWKVREALDKVAVHRQLRQLRRRHQRAGRSDPARSFVPRVVGRRAAGVGRDRSRSPSVAGPAMKPLLQTRATPDVLLDVASKLKKPLGLPWQTFDEMLKATFDGARRRRVDDGAEAGRVVGTSLPRAQAAAGSRAAATRTRRDREASRATPSRVRRRRGAVSVPFPAVRVAGVRDGSLAHLPWLQEMPDPLTSAMWSSWVEINPQTAERLGIAQGDIVEIASPHGARARAGGDLPGIAPDVVAMPVGQGHETFTRYATGRGANPVAILAPVAEAEDRRAGLGGDAREDRARRRSRRHADPVLGGAARCARHPTRRERHSGNGASMGNGRRSRSLHGLRSVRGRVSCREQHPDGRRAQAARGRAMHWIRVERYWEGEFPDVRLKFRPVMCQQCDAAPCEPVCPTYASHHTDEGLNAQVYNRCIGTRYCANACPYNVRFFDFFNPQWDKPLHLQLNPDVSVREVGVMEKCTFCVQRIKAAKIDGQGREARAEGRRASSRPARSRARRRRWCSAT